MTTLSSLVRKSIGGTRACGEQAETEKQLGDTQQLLLDALDNGAKLQEENAKLRARLEMAEAENKQLRDKIEGGGCGEWAKLDRLKDDFAALSTSNPRVADFPAWVGFLCMGRTVTQNLAAATREAALDVLLDVTKLGDKLSDFADARTRHTHELQDYQSQVVDARRAADALPKGTRKAEAIDTLLTKCQSQMKFVSGYLGDEACKAQDGLEEFKASRASRRATAKEKIRSVKEMCHKHIRNLEIFVDKVEQHFEQETSGFARRIAGEASGHAAVLFDTYKELKERGGDLVASKNRLIADRNATCSELTAMLNDMADVDPRGDDASRTLATAQGEVDVLAKEVDDLESIQKETNSYYADFFAKLKEAHVDVRLPSFQAAPRQVGAKRKREELEEEALVDSGYFTPEEADDGSDWGSPSAKRPRQQRARLSTRAAQWLMSFLSPVD